MIAGCSNKKGESRQRFPRRSTGLEIHVVELLIKEHSHRKRQVARLFQLHYLEGSSDGFAGSWSDSGTYCYARAPFPCEQKSNLITGKK